MSDLRFAVRQLARNPGFALAAILTLALGIGATTAVFSVVNGVLLEPLPYGQPDRLVALWTRYLPSSGLDIEQFPLSPPEYVDYRESSRAMADVVPYWTRSVSLTDEANAPIRVGAGYLGAGMFDLLGVRAALGRTFAPEEETPDAAPTVILSHGLWRERFGGDPEILGRSILVSGQAARIVGVMPEGFVFPRAAQELWLPLGLDEAALTNRFAHFLYAVGRLAPGASLEAAEAELETITAAWNREFEHHAMGHFIFLRSLRADLVGDAGSALWLLFAAVGVVLLVACVNVANLLIARMESRQLEIAVRSALGADRVRLARGFLVESLVLAAAGAVLGLTLAAWGTPALLAIHPTAVPRVENVAVDPTVLFFAVGITLGTALLFGLAPAGYGGTGGSAARALTETRSTTGRARARFRRALVSLEAALSLGVVLAAALVTRSFIEITKIDPGLDAGNVLTFDLLLPSTRYGEAAEVPDVYAWLLERIGALPGVAGASAASAIPVADDPPRVDFRIEGRPEPPPGVPASNADAIAIQPRYFETLGVPVIRGRTVTREDGPEGPFVAIINQTAAERYWPGEEAVGRRFRYASDPPRPWITIVGVVGDTKVNGLRGESRAQVYLPHRQLRASQGSTGRSLTVIVRTALPPQRLVAPVRAAVHEFDPQLPLAELRTMEEVLALAAARPRFTASLLAAFAVIALVLAAIGVYGVVSYVVLRRTREIGIRVALGARKADILRRVVREGMQPVAIGAIAGLALALAAADAVSGLLFQVSERDPATFLLVPFVLLSVALVACYLPARRATRIDPTEAMRHE